MGQFTEEINQSKILMCLKFWARIEHVWGVCWPYLESWGKHCTACALVYALQVMCTISTGSSFPDIHCFVRSSGRQSYPHTPTNTVI